MIRFRQDAITSGGPGGLDRTIMVIPLFVAIILAIAPVTGCGKRGESSVPSRSQSSASLPAAPSPPADTNPAGQGGGKLDGATPGTASPENEQYESCPLSIEYADKSATDRLTADALRDLYSSIFMRLDTMWDEPLLVEGSRRELVSWPLDGYGFSAWDGQDDLARHSARCRSGVSRSCFVQAFLTEGITGITWDVGQVRKLYKRACSGGIMAACDMLDAYSRNGNRASVPFGERNSVLMKACGGGDWTSCWLQGLALEQGPDVKEDPRWGRSTTEMADLFRKACDAGVGEACHNLRGALEDEMNFDHPAEPEAEADSERLARRACDLGIAAACLSLGLKTLFETDRDEGGDWPRETNMKAARRLFGQSCDIGDAQSCLFLGVTWADFDSKTMDMTKAVTAFRRACDLGHAAGCARWGNAQLEGAPDRKAHYSTRRAFQRGCDLGDADSCLQLGEILARGADDKNVSQAGMNAFRRAAAILGNDLCGTNEGAWVRSMAPEEMKLMIRACGIACTGGFGRACGLLGQQVEYMAGNIPVCADTCTRSLAHAFEVKGCDLGDQDSCAWLASDLEEPVGAKTDEDPARKYWEAACTVGSSANWCLRAVDSVMPDDGAWDGTYDFVPFQLRMLEAGCVRGDSGACVMFGEFLAGDERTDVDNARAREFLHFACVWGDGDGCVMLGDMWFRGRGGRRDVNVATDLWQRAARTRSGYGSYRLGLIEFDKSEDRGIARLESACNGIDVDSSPCFEACIPLAMARLFVDRNVEAAREILESEHDAVESGVGSVELAALMFARDPAGAAEIFAPVADATSLECRDGTGDACLALADWYKATGQLDWESRYRTAGLAALDADCKLGIGYACVMKALRQN